MARLLLIVAAGSGGRLGRGEPKALVPLCGRPLLVWALEGVATVAFDRAVLAAPPDRLDEVALLAGGRFQVVAGGTTRSDSVRRGVAALAPLPGDLVCVHDAARPFVAPAEIEAVLAAAAQVGAAIAATPIVDTVKRVEAGRIVATLDRRELFGAATPQAFRGEILERALAAGKDGTDEATLCEELKIPVAVVPVSRLCFKITTPEDLEVAEAILRSRGSGGAA
ncbi:MAG: 2-C-methyl-D-erythritol 4-phosphate cytidylyltransferase [Thermoanaerobaculia bacterium]